MDRVRHCDLDDLQDLVGFAYKFNDRYYDVPLDYEKLLQYLINLMNSPEGVVMRTDHGAITGVFVEDHLRKWNVLVETAWFSEGRAGLRLLEAFCNVGEWRGADEVRMTTLEANKGVERVLQRKGFTPIETSHRLLL